MIYTGSAQYAIRAMVRLASQEDSTPMSSAGVAEAEKIPPFYLAKILQDLGRAGLLHSVRGRGGGFTLSRAADEISVADVVHAVENPRRLETDCVLGMDDCSDETPCPLHETWKGFREGALEALRTMTIAQLAAESSRKRKA